MGIKLDGEWQIEHSSEASSGGPAARKGENVPDNSSPWSLMKPVAGQVRSLGTYSSQHPLPGGQSEGI